MIHGRQVGGEKPMRGHRVLLAVLVAGGALAACQSQMDGMIAEGHDPAYAAGYQDGCSSGRKAAGGALVEGQKDASRYGSDSQYKEGWDAGAAKCQAEEERMIREARARNPSRSRSN
jgi:hypothetical protein